MNQEIQVTEIMEAVEGLHFEARRYEKLAKVTQLLERIGSLHQAGNEVQARLDELRPLADETAQSLAETNAQIESARNEATDIVGKAQTQAKQMLLEASAQAEETRKKGIADADAAVKIAEKKVTDLQNECALAAEKTMVARKELGELETKITAAKKAVHQILG